MKQTQQQSLYEAATFECLLCNHSFQLSFTDIKALLNPFHHVNCPYCDKALSLQLASRNLLVKRFNSMLQLSRLLIGFAIPYFLVSVFIIWHYGGLIGASFLIGGFALLSLLRLLLKRPIEDLYYLEAVKAQPLS